MLLLDVRCQIITADVLGNDMKNETIVVGEGNYGNIMGPFMSHHVSHFPFNVRELLLRK